LLGYEYDDLTSGPTPVSLTERLERLAIPALEGALAVPDDTEVELVGATTEPVPVRGDGAQRDVRLDSGMRRKVVASLSPTRMEMNRQVAPDRVFLNLENVRGESDAAAFDVFVGVPDDQDAADHPDRLAGSIAPFGLRKASAADDEHAGQGLTFVLEITDIVDRLHLENSFDVDRLPVRIVPVRPVADEVGLTIGRISIFRQGS
jgi:tyrosinase